MEITVGIFAAAGLLFFLWALLGCLLLPLSRGGVTVWFVNGEGHTLERQVRSFLYLRDSGLFQGKLLLCDCGLSSEGRLLAMLLSEIHDGVEYCTEDTLSNRLHLGAAHDRTGRNHDSRHGAGHRVSES